MEPLLVGEVEFRERTVDGVRSDPAYNPYVRWPGYLAFVGLFFGFVAPMINVIWGEPDVFTGQQPEFNPVNPAFVFGVACGLLWLTVRAITAARTGR